MRPYDEQRDKPITVDLLWLTTGQRKLWDRHLPHLAVWTQGTWCQVTRLELLNFGYFCMLEDQPPRWPIRVPAKRFSRPRHCGIAE